MTQNLLVPIIVISNDKDSDNISIFTTQREIKFKKSVRNTSVFETITLIQYIHVHLLRGPLRKSFVTSVANDYILIFIDVGTQQGTILTYYVQNL